MIRAILVDDEERSRKNLTVLLLDFCSGVEVLATAKSVKEAIEAVKEHRPDVVFLDIQMQGETGFDFLSDIDKVDFEVVFTTAHAEYAINAIRFAAVDYLLKPIDIGDLKHALTKIEGKKRHEEEIMHQINTLLHNIRVSDPNDYLLAIPSAEKMHFAPMNEVVYCEAKEGSTTIYLKNGESYIVPKLLKEYDNLLSQFAFFRTDNFFLINTKEIKRFVDAEDAYVVLNNEAQIPISKRKKEAFLKLVNS